MRIYTKEYSKEKFSKLYKKSSGCWDWEGSVDKQGRGKWETKLDDKWVMMSAPRFAYLFYYGSLDKTLSVCHTCDNPSCVNPEHLWQGTQHQNMQDSSKKGRNKKMFGESNGNYKHGLRSKAHAGL